MLTLNKLFILVEEQNKKNAKPRVIKNYRPVKEYYPWRVVAIPAVFPVIGFLLFAKAAADITKKIRFAGGFYLLLGLIFVGIGVMFASAHVSEFSSCRRVREKRESAEKRGMCYQGTILGYKVNVGTVFPQLLGSEVPAISMTYVLEVEFWEDTKYKTIETNQMRYHPNAVLKGTRCDVCFYEGEYFVCNFDLRTGSKDGVAEIPQTCMPG